MATLAKYTVQIPTHDNEGNKLKDIASITHESLSRHAPQSVRISGSRIRRGIQGNWRDDKPEMFDDLEVYAEDSPEVDSLMKQTGVHVAEITNQWGIMVFKEGKGAPQAWMMTHPTADGKGPADPLAVAEKPPDPAAASLS